MVTKAILHIGYCEFILNADKAQLVFEHLSNAECNIGYLGVDDAKLYGTTAGRTIQYQDGQSRLTCELLSETEWHNGMDRASAKERYEMRQELEREEEERNATQAA